MVGWDGKDWEGRQWWGRKAKMEREGKGRKEDSGGEERQRWGGKAKVERVGQIWEGLQMRREGKGGMLRPMWDDLERQGG